MMHVRARFQWSQLADRRRRIHDPNEWHPPQSAEAMAVEVHILSTTLGRADALQYQFCIENPPKNPQHIKQCDALIGKVGRIDERLEKQVKDWYAIHHRY